MGQIKQIRYDAERDRLMCGDVDLHCGQGLRVLMADGEWYDVVLELDGADQWYLPHHPGVSPIGLWAQV